MTSFDEAYTLYFQVDKLTGEVDRKYKEIATLLDLPDDLDESGVNRQGNDKDAAALSLRTKTLYEDIEDLRVQIHQHFSLMTDRLTSRVIARVVEQNDTWSKIITS